MTTTGRTYHSFSPLPSDEPLVVAWPTPNQTLLTAATRFFARTRVNPDYGKPGWTRDCGQRMHWGCDIAPVKVTATGETRTVTFTDCDSGADFDSIEPAFVPHDPIYCVYPGRVHELVDDESASDFGKHLVLLHQWPQSQQPFYTLYGHLAQITARSGMTVSAGQPLGVMGQTARSADARNWMAIAPHLHFEVWDHAQQPYNPVAFLEAFVRRP